MKLILLPTYFSGIKTLTIKLPHELSPEQEHDLKMELAGTLYTKGLLSTSEAAAMVGIGRREFIEQMGGTKYR